MAREVSLSEAEINQLEQDLSSGKIAGPTKVFAQTLLDNAKPALAKAPRDDVGWYFSWTYRF